MKPRMAVAGVLVACGRVSFDPAPSATDAPAAVDAAVLPTCDTDDFSDGVGDGWQNDGGRWTIGAGPSGPTWDTQFAGATFTYRVPNPHHDEVDYELDASIAQLGFGDVFLQLINDTGQNYQVTLHPSGSDDPSDTLMRLEQPDNVILDEAPNRIAGAAGWSRLRLVRGTTSIQVFVDGVEHLSTTDTTFRPPYAVDVGFLGGGAVDNVTLRCR